MSNENLSWGRVVGKDSIKSIELPEELYDHFTKSIKTSRLLIIFTPRKDLLKIDVFPVESNEIIKIQLHLLQFSGETLKKIGEIIQKMDITRNLYTTGVCIREDLCLYEVYLEEEGLKYSAEQLEQEFRSIKDVQKVYIQKLT
ncbi:MAG: hypothetical protein ACTSRZ_20860 [Promethearchaeota archaeon]